MLKAITRTVGREAEAGSRGVTAGGSWAWGGSGWGSGWGSRVLGTAGPAAGGVGAGSSGAGSAGAGWTGTGAPGDRKSTRLNSSHVKISYAVFCLKKKIK